MSTAPTKRTESSLTRCSHHCNLVLSFWCRSLDIDPHQTFVSTDSLIYHAIVYYRGPGDIVALTCNATLSSIEIYNRISNPANNTEEPSLSSALSSVTDPSDISIQPVHNDAIFQPSSGSISSGTPSHPSWHPTLCTTLNYRFLYRIGGADPYRGLFGESSNAVDAFDLHTLKHISLPPMIQRRANSSAAILPPTIPFHDSADTDLDLESPSDHANCSNLLEVFKQIKSKSVPTLSTAPTPAPVPAPLPPKLTVPSAPIPLVLSQSSPSGTPTPLAATPPLSLMHPTVPIAPPISLKNASLSPKGILYGGRAMKNQLESQNSQNSERSLQNARPKYPEYALLVCGGLNGSVLHKKSEVFYPLEGSWQPIMNMKQARCGHVTQYMGATHWKRSWSQLDADALTCQMQDWKDVSDLTTKVFVCGGRREHGNGITSCECYDLEKNTWSICQRAPFTNHGSQSGCWWSTRQCVALVSDPLDGNQVALYLPERNKWEVVDRSVREGNVGDARHFYPLVGTLWLFAKEYLYVVGDDWKVKSLELWDERSGQWIGIGREYALCKEKDERKRFRCQYDRLGHLTRHRQFDALASVS